MTGPPCGDVGKCPQCGQQTRSYSRGCSWCGFNGQPCVPVEQSTDQGSAGSPTTDIGGKDGHEAGSTAEPHLPADPFTCRLEVI